MADADSGERKARARTIQVDYLARVEGEGALKIRLKGGAVDDVELKIFEPPRFFEAFLRGRAAAEVPDITARICGICPVAYQLSAVSAVEDALGVKVDGALRALRRLLYCGEWIESHGLHVYMLHAPDFLGFPDGVAMARRYPTEVQRGLQLKKAGNAIVTLLGGREIHPINVRVGGFYKLPARRDLLALAEQLRPALDAALETARWVSQFAFPDYEYDFEFVALRDEAGYPLERGRIVSSQGLDIGVSEFNAHFVEEHVRRSNALHARLRARGSYLVGPLSRYNLNHDRLSPLSQQAAREAGLLPVCKNPFQSIIVRAVELVYAVEEALRLIDEYRPPAAPVVAMPGPGVMRGGVGHGCTEAPRGLLYHRYEVDAGGSITAAQIVPPTSQNQRTIEEDLRSFVGTRTELPDDELRGQCEQAIRNYDPCISCATHFLKLEVDRQ